MANTFKFGNGNWAVKKDSVLAYNDENNNFKPLPFDFTRDTIGTYVDSDGLIKTAASGEARIDYLGNTNGHLLLEPSRTNLSTDSERMDLWSSLRTTETINSGLSPDGENNAVKISMTSDTGEHSVYDGLSIETSTAYTNSIFIKRGTGSADWQYFQFRFRNGGYGTGGGVVVDIHNGQITYNTGLTDYGIENYGDGWYRVFITQTSTNASSSAGPVLAFNEISNGYDVNIVGDTNADVLVWGSQFEAGSHSTSYIPTSGSSVTRAADTANGAGNSEVFNDSEGVLYAEVYSSAKGENRQLGISDGSSSDRAIITLRPDDETIRFYFEGTTGGSTQIDFAGNNFNNSLKIAGKYKSGDVALWVDGFEVGTSSSAITASGLNVLDFYNTANSALAFYGNTKEIKYYNAVLTDAELEYETSYRSLSEMVTELNLNTL